MANKMGIEALIEAVLAELPDTPEDYESFRSRVVASIPGSNEALKFMLKQRNFQPSFRFEGTKPILQVAKKQPAAPIP